MDDGICLSHSPGRRKDPLKGESKWSTSQLLKNKAGGLVPSDLLEYLHILTSESRMDEREQRRYVKCSSWAEEV
jgi:hypothetical protein